MHTYLYKQDSFLKKLSKVFNHLKQDCGNLNFSNGDSLKWLILHTKCKDTCYRKFNFITYLLIPGLLKSMDDNKQRRYE